MAGRSKTSKFRIYAPGKSGYYKNKRLLGINIFYEGDKNDIKLQDLLDFLKEENIHPSTVQLYNTFGTVVHVQPK